jgi:AraC-like DNA-binding protein
MRLQRAVDAISKGLTATDAAHAAGFADAAHLTRTFRRMMGIAPTSVKIDRRPQAQ